ARLARREIRIGRGLAAAGLGVERGLVPGSPARGSLAGLEGVVGALWGEAAGVSSSVPVSGVSEVDLCRYQAVAPTAKTTSRRLSAELTQFADFPGLRVVGG
ncbi:MAG: hypothetical protein V3R60_02465, partial [Acidobacteriota bacterium]